MDAFDWESFLKRWSQQILESMSNEEKGHLPPDVLASGWLGYPGATDAELDRVEARLNIELPPSYRAFLKVSNGWRQTASKTDNFNHRIWSTEDIEPFSARHLQWIKASTERNGTTDIVFEEDFQELDDRWEPVGVTDEDYLVYGPDQDPSSLRPEYLRTAIEISDVGCDSIYLLNPQVVTPEGEWEAWFFADYLPGADRYRSFQVLMEAEYRNFLERQTSSEEDEEPTGTSQKRPPVNLSFTDGSASPAAGTSASTIPKSPVQAESISPVGDEVVPWRSLNQLTVEFQGRFLADGAEYRTIANSQDVPQAQTWSGLAESQLHQWLRQRIENVNSVLAQEAVTPSSAVFSPFAPVADVASTEPTTATTTPPVTEPSTALSPPSESSLTVNLDVEQFAICQPAQPGAQILVRPSDIKPSKHSGIGTLSSQQPFSIEVAFHLAVEHRHHPALPNIFYKTQVFAQNRTNHQWIELGKSTPKALESDRSTYTAALLNKTLDSGMYRLQIITSLSGAAMALSSFELPLLNVI